MQQSVCLCVCVSGKNLDLGSFKDDTSHEEDYQTPIKIFLYLEKPQICVSYVTKQAKHSYEGLLFSVVFLSSDFLIFYLRRFTLANHFAKIDQKDNIR